MLPETVTVVENDGKTYYLVGTAHVSTESVKEVGDVCEEVKPDSICIELCQKRYDNIKNRDQWKKTDVFTVIKEKKVLLLLTNLIMSSFYKRLGKELDVEPGAEQMKGAQEAENLGVNLVLADRNIDITLKRVWGGLTFGQKVKVIFALFSMLFFASEKIDKDTIEDMKQSENIGDVVDELAKEFPGIKTRLLDERDLYLAEKIRTAEGKKIVAVLGAAHCKGVAEHIKTPFDLSEIEKIPPKSVVPAIIGWGICAAIIALLVYGFLSNAEKGVENIFWFWVLTGGFSSLFCVFAFAHPLTILTAFFAAPFAVIHPMIATGWIAGLVQAAIKKPTVVDMENVASDTESVSGFWRNSLTRILLVVVFANIGATLGASIAMGKIFTNIF
jgi:pheromone shutdown-related protein TraB